MKTMRLGPGWWVCAVALLIVAQEHSGVFGQEKADSKNRVSLTVKNMPDFTYRIVRDGKVTESGIGEDGPRRKTAYIALVDKDVRCVALSYVVTKQAGFGYWYDGVLKSGSKSYVITGKQMLRRKVELALKARDGQPLKNEHVCMRIAIGELFQTQPDLKTDDKGIVTFWAIEKPLSVSLRIEPNRDEARRGMRAHIGQTEVPEKGEYKGELKIAYSDTHSFRIKMLERKSDGTFVKCTLINVYVDRDDGIDWGHSIEDGFIWLICSEEPVDKKRPRYQVGERVKLDIGNDDYVVVKGGEITIGHDGEMATAIVEKVKHGRVAWTIRERGVADTMLDDVRVIFRRVNGPAWTVGLFGSEWPVRCGTYEYRAWKYGFRLFGGRADVSAGNNKIDVALKRAKKGFFKMSGWEGWKEGRKDSVELLYKMRADSLGAKGQEFKGKAGDFWYDPTLPCVLIARSSGSGAAVLQVSRNKDEYELVVKKPVRLKMDLSPILANVLKRKPIVRVVWLCSAASPKVKMDNVELEDGTATAMIAPGKYVPIIHSVEIGKHGTEDLHFVCEAIECGNDAEQSITLKPQVNQNVDDFLEY